MNAKGKLIKARTQLVLDQPFFGSLALRLVLVEDEKAATAYTNGVVLGYNRAFITGLSLEQTKWLVAHEVMHLACLHHTRRAKRDPARWNVAADYAINALLAEAGFKTPAGCLLDQRYNGKSAEAIYAMFPDTGKDKHGSGSDEHSSQPGEIRDGRRSPKFGQYVKLEVSRIGKELTRVANAKILLSYFPHPMVDPQGNFFF